MARKELPAEIRLPDGSMIDTATGLARKWQEELAATKDLVTSSRILAEKGVNDQAFAKLHDALYSKRHAIGGRMPLGAAFANHALDVFDESCRAYETVYGEGKFPYVLYGETVRYARIPGATTILDIRATRGLIYVSGIQGEEKTHEEIAETEGISIPFSHQMIANGANKLRWLIAVRHAKQK